MTLEEIKNRIERIKDVIDDDEVAHIREDGLYFEFIESLAKEGNERAKEILKTRDLDFGRWCA